jgi:hypothetical protein
MQKRCPKRPPRGSLESDNPPQKRGPEATLKAKVIPMLEASGLTWWRNQSGMVRIVPFKGKSYLMRLGRPGLPDLMLLSRVGQLICVELKSPTGTLNPDQEIFFTKANNLQDSWVSSNGNITYPLEVFIVRTVEQMKAIIAYANNGTPPEMHEPGRRKWQHYEPKV